MLLLVGCGRSLGVYHFLQSRTNPPRGIQTSSTFSPGFSPLIYIETKILDRNPAALLSHSPSRAFLLSKTQHLIGGFAKHAGGPPDVYHSFLGLAALATMGEPTLKPFDPALCVSTETVRKIGVARQELLRRAETGGQTRDVLELGTLMAGGWPKWLAAKG